ncbi:hypothetical protein CARUB_v10011883mg [Capsella rubella]|uniref:PPM-type phosphatase domain-containing protein n=1 Tax=Capsella rubella TaxID=81985 RepID=R0IID4_9BRAS|nr:hypothetical protein CARUB_v10011883mg [Capsella rubella]
MKVDHVQVLATAIILQDEVPTTQVISTTRKVVEVVADLSSILFRDRNLKRVVYARIFSDEYLEPYVIPDPQVMFMARAREDECLILASDGLWDVMSNQEACELARKRKNEAFPLAVRGVEADQACQAAAAYLSKLSSEGKQRQCLDHSGRLESPEKVEDQILKQVDAITTIKAF